MSNLTRLVRFLSWVRSVSDDLHLGKEILSQAPNLDFLPFFVNQSMLEEFFVRIFIEDEELIEGYILAMSIDPENNSFLIQIFEGEDQEAHYHDFKLDKLKTFEQHSTNMDIVNIEQAKSKMRFHSQASASLNKKHQTEETNGLRTSPHRTI